MKESDLITCPYCGCELVRQAATYYCDFCVMQLGPDQIQHNHERLSVRVRDFAPSEYVAKTTPELMILSTFELLCLLKYVRAERTAMYQLMNTFYKARKQQASDDYRTEEAYSRQEYERMTRKMFVLENLIRKRLGFVPSRITEQHLNRYLENMRKDKLKPMVIRKERRAGSPKRYANS
ncbi:hypothetical protein M3557_14645 [Bhargavaea ginsengi]|uniref:hypothetical protein n=1 Tax=Bhargavaea ginsengi TaxID=426757 RepID=UPI00203F48EF|nr:hypothetical protein [Bhargavaea ginsengi]MCM3089155.1 hypothetical protein [Bhargavaea ginsengi]